MEIGTELASTRDVDALLGPVIERLETLLGAEAATLFMYEEQVGELVGRVVRGGALEELRLKADRGVAGHVARTGESLLLADAYGDPRFNPDVDRKSGFKTRAMIAVPLRHVSGRCLGVVQVLHRRAGAFSEEDHALVEAIAAQIAGVLDNLLLMDTLRMQNEALRRAMDELSVAMRDLDLLYELEQAVHSAEGEAELLDKVLAKATRLIGAEAGSILLRSEERNQLYFRSSKGEQSEALKRLTLRMGQGIAGHVATTGEVVRVEKADTCPHHERALMRKLGISTRSVLCVPIKGDDRILGALELLNKPGGFDAGDERLATLVAGQTGRAVLLRRDRLEGEQKARLAALGQLMSGVMHDLKTPMTVISGYAQLMALEDSAEERARIAATIEKQFEHVAAMTGETLAFARGERELLVRKVYLQHFFADLETYLRAELESAGVELKLQIHYTGAARLDEAKVKRVISNIARNAADAMPGGGRFTLVADRDGNQLVLRMSDTGTGVPEEVQERVFESFVTAGKEGGSGLGLAIVKRIVDAHGGSVEFKSRAGKGTTFEVRLPL
jgi:signal transduction histidine kinase